MHLLVVNAGSSSLKFELFQGKSHELNSLYSGIVDGLNKPKAIFLAHVGRRRVELEGRISNHEEAFEMAANVMMQHAVIPSLKTISRVVHRVVHGGNKFWKPTLLTPKVIATIKKLSSLAPLHNPPNLEGIKIAKKLLPHAKHYAVFDTGFYHDLPETAALYALPYSLRSEIRRFGFHGISHEYVTCEALKFLKKPARIISCHLGNGASITGSLNGKPIDTSMGFTPLEGVPMGTRSGDIDPAIIFYLMREKKMKPGVIEAMLQFESGLKGISGISHDMRELLRSKHPRAKLAIEIFCYRVAKYIGAYTAALNGLDALIFTGGIGENAFYVREKICLYLKFLGVTVDRTKNRRNAYLISPEKSLLRVFVIPTDEEKFMANKILALMSFKTDKEVLKMAKKVMKRNATLLRSLANK